MHRRRFYATQLMKLFFQAVLYISLFAVYIGILSIANAPLLRFSRTAVRGAGGKEHACRKAERRDLK